MLGQILHAHRLEGAGADVQRHQRALNTALGEQRHECGIEMQARGRRGYRAWLTGKHALIALAVSGERRAANVRRQRYLAPALEEFQRRLRQADAPQIAVAAQDA